MMRVVKRAGDQEEVSFDKVLNRIKNLSNNLNVNVYEVAQKVCSRIYDGVKTTELDELAAHMCSSMMLDHPDYGTLASRIIISNHHKNTSPSFSETIQHLYENRDVHGASNPLVSDELYDTVQKNKEKLNSYLDYSRDYTFDYFGFKTLEKAYLMRVNNKVVERPQQMFMRVALGIHGNDVKDALQTYDLMSRRYFVHATPTLFNSGTPRPQNSSCFVKGTVVYTQNRGPVAIEDVNIGDLVITHNNRVRMVSQKHKNPINGRRLYSFRCANIPTIIATQDHPFMTLSPGRGDVPAWTDIEHVSINDYIQLSHFSIPKNCGERFIELGGGNDVGVDDNFACLVGLWLTCGSNIGKGRARFTCPQPHHPSDILENYAAMTVFDTSCSVVSGVENGQYVVEFEPSPALSAFMDMFGSTHEVKKLPTSVFNWDDDCVFHLASIVLHSDLMCCGNMTVYKQVSQLMRSRGHIYVGDYENKLALDSGLIKLHNDRIFVKVLEKYLVTNRQDAEVYTLGVEEDHSYSVNGIIAKNCYLVAMKDDSIEGIYDTLKQCALISKYAGGIGVHIHNIRARNSIIRGTNGISTGIIPMLRVFNNTARYVNQCFAPDTHIMTTNGLMHIENVHVGTMVITNDGSPKPVLGVAINHVTKEVLQFYASHVVKPITVTKEHEICVYDKIQSQVVYKYAEEINVNNDMVGFPIFPSLYFSNFDSNYYMFYGLMLMNGNMFSNGGCSIKCYRAAAVHFVTNFLKQHDIKFWQYRNRTRKGVIIRWITDKSKLDFSRDHLYDHTTGLRKMHNTFVYLDHTQRDDVVKGILMDANQSRIVTNNGFATEYSIKNNDDTMMQLIALILIQHGYKCVFDKSVLFVRYAPSEYFVHDGMIWTNIDRCRRIEYSGNVYDLNVQDNHNYTTALGLVHNSGRRNGSIAIYLEPWHADIDSFLELRKNHGHEEDRARDLFYALWIPDLFMERVRDNGVWSLMCPDKCRGLSDVYGKDFVKLYEEYERKGMYVKQVKAQELWFSILESQIETGTPYMLYKDSINRKNNQENIGIVKSSNLCSEIVEVSSSSETAVCNLASICLPSYVETDQDGVTKYNFDKLHDIVKVVTKNLNKVIDRNFYPTEEAKRSNLLHRPIGIGVQGLADTFIMMRYPFDSDKAKQLNIDISETMYHAALEASMELAQKHGKTYSTFQGSPASKGSLQFDMWGVKPSTRYDWDKLKSDIKEYGLLNSLTIALMPTASTSQIMGFNEAFEPLTSNLYKRKTLAGEFILINKYLITDLTRLGLWNGDMKNKIILNDGSIQNILEIPQEIRDLYKVVWEIKQKNVIDMAADRSPYIDQSQSMNLFIESPDFKKLSSMHFYAWQKGLKTGMYYLRTKAKAKAQNFTIDPKLAKFTNIKNEEPVCESCSA